MTNAEHDRSGDTGSRTDGAGALEALWRSALRLFRAGNRRQLALRDRQGGVLLRLPLTIAVIIAVVLLWRALPLLLLVAVAAIALGGRLVVLRRD